MNGTSIGKRLRLARGSMASVYVAEKVGISPSALSMYERGARVPRDEIKIELAKFYGTTVGALFFNE